MREQNNIRVKVLAWIEEDGHLFVVRMHDSVKGDDYYRPIGGSVEFGETTKSALHREVLEELGTAITITGEPLVLENLFTCDGKPGHEIDYIYPSKFVDPAFMQHRVFTLKEANGTEFEATWIDQSSFLNGTLRLVPEALLDWYHAKR